MKKINLEIKALSPLAIGRQKPGGNVSEVEQYVPGSVIRGAVASQILKRTNSSISDGDDFHQLFLGDKPAIFQNAYLAHSKIKSEIRVIPATALSSKAKSGFKTKGNGVFDTLIDRFCAEKYSYIYEPNCPVDGGRVDTFTGFYTQKDEKYYQLSADHRLLTRVGINRRRATSEERVLYSIAVLNESQEKKQQPQPVIYTGEVLVNNDLAISLQQFIQNHQDDLRLGGAGSRGLGKVKISAKAPIDIKSTVINRIDNFNQKLRQRWSEWGKIFGNPLETFPENRTYFTVDLQADAILTEKWRSTTVISTEMLQQYTSVNDFSLHIHAVYSSYDYRSGWNSAWGLMKDIELVTNKGSVYLFSTENKNLWLQAWENLEVYGVGDRTCEGFGQVQICNEFHSIFRENAK